MLLLQDYSEVVNWREI